MLRKNLIAVAVAAAISAVTPPLKHKKYGRVLKLYLRTL